MTNRLIILILLIFISKTSYAFDIHNVSFDQALKSKGLVFVGFVESIHVTEKNKDSIKARAGILVEKCLGGKQCHEGKMINVQYLAQSSAGTILPVTISVGNQVVIAIDNEINTDDSKYEFDSDVNGGTDYCYVCNAFPYSIIDPYSVFSCNDTITGQIYKELSWSKISEIRSSVDTAPNSFSQ